MIDQVTVFLENRAGRLAALSRTIADAGIDMYALTIADTADYGLVRIICSHPRRAVKVLDEAGYRAISTRVAAIEIPDRLGALADLLKTLDELNLNIEYGYCFGFGDGKAVDVFKITNAEENDEASKALAAAGFRALQPSDLR